MASEKDSGAPTQSEAGAVSQAARTSVPGKSEPVAEEAAGEKRGVEELGADAASQDAAKKSRGDDAGARSARGRGGSGHGRGRRGRGRGAERAVCARDSGDGQADRKGGGRVYVGRGDDEDGGSEGDKVQKRMTAVQIAYVGSRYSGLQKNPGQETIEAELERALHKAGLIAECNFGDLHKVHWSRAARTDKGVHALGNIVACKLLAPPDVDVVAMTNRELPEDIRVLDMKRVTKGFNAKNQAEGRRYQYLIPTYAFRSCLRPDPSTCKQFVDDDLPAWMREGHNKHIYTPTAHEVAAARALRASAVYVISRCLHTHSHH